MQLSPPSITRRTDRGLPSYSDTEHRDTFILSGAEDLVPRLDEDGAPQVRLVSEGGVDYRVHTYRPRVESDFSRIERWVPQGVGPGGVLWRVRSSGNVMSSFGESAAGRVVDPDAPWRVFTWLLERVEDDRGNVTLYESRAEDTVGVDILSPAEQRPQFPPQFTQFPGAQFPDRGAAQFPDRGLFGRAWRPANSQFPDRAQFPDRQFPDRIPRPNSRTEGCLGGRGAQVLLEVAPWPAAPANR